MSKKQIHVAVTGAAGQIGYALLFRIAAGEMFGPDTEVHLHLLELLNSFSALEGVVMELEDCAFSLLSGITATTDPKEAFKDVDWAVLVGSVPRKAGMERKDLLKINSGIFADQGRALSENAKKECKVLVVGNPCNTNAYVAKTVAENIPDKNFFALTMLDQNRAVSQIAKKAGVKIGDVQNLFVWGNHSATQYPDFYNATIKGAPVEKVINDERWLQQAFIEAVQKRGAGIIKKRGRSSAASAANAIINTVSRMTGKTQNDDSLSLAVSSDGSYGIQEGIMFSFPVRSNGTGWEIVQGVEHNSFSREKIMLSYEELLEEKKAVDSFLNL